MGIDLVWIGSGSTPPAWDDGRIVASAPDPTALVEAVRPLAGEAHAPDDAVLFWSDELVPPPGDVLVRLLAQPDDAWHAGLLLGNTGRPRSLDSVAASWMLTRDAPGRSPSTSWRITFGALLVRWRVLEALGFADTSFRSLTGAGLELGYRWVWQGVRLRHTPELVDANTPLPPAPALPLEDELRFIARGFARRWFWWTTVRVLGQRRWRALGLVRQVRALRGEPPQPTVLAAGAAVDGHLEPRRLPREDTTEPKVTVLVPTVERYPYLRTVLEQLRDQKLAPHQVVVVDQTPARDRDQRLRTDFADLPLTWLERDVPGQCSARNAGLEAATGDHVLFIDDDDDELGVDLLARHLDNLQHFGLDVSSGGVHEPEAGPTLDEFRWFRVSDTFPTNNTMVRREVLERSGWFDLAYDHGERADHDLGMRLYLAGCRMAFDPTIKVLHHHAPRGGLRVHRARTVTYGGSRRTLLGRQRLSPTQMYLWRRYFTASQCREAELLHLAGVLNGSGGRVQRLARAVIQLVLLPGTVRAMNRSRQRAAQLAARYPDIPHVPLSTS